MSAKTNALEAAKKALPKNVIVATVPTVEEATLTKQIGNLKQTPELPMDFNAKLNAMKRLEQINVNLGKLEATKALLVAFKLEETSSANSQPYITIKDSGYGNTTEFKTYNVGIIKGVIDFISEDVDAKIKFVKNQIAEFELPKI
jgi:hypothetical protein